MQNYYTKDFYKTLRDHLLRQSAEEIVPLVLKLIPCKQVIDVGCGDGTWLQVFKEHGVEEILGVDGEYVDENILEIPKEQFMSFDLKKPLRINKQFELVVSLEVAEHIPAECAEIFIDSLTSLGPVILFSAAIPYQGGINHINEQWPEYWAKRFQARNYVVIDCIRKKIWHNENVQWWYTQNILIFAKQDYLENNFLLNQQIKSFDNTDISWLSVVHPKLYVEKNKDLLNTKTQLLHTNNKKLARKRLGVLVEVIKTAIKKIELHLSPYIHR